MLLTFVLQLLRCSTESTTKKKKVLAYNFLSVVARIFFAGAETIASCFLDEKRPSAFSDYFCGSLTVSKLFYKHTILLPISLLLQSTKLLRSKPPTFVLRLCCYYVAIALCICLSVPTAMSPFRERSFRVIFKTKYQAKPSLIL